MPVDLEKLRKTAANFIGNSSRSWTSTTRVDELVALLVKVERAGIEEEREACAMLCDRLVNTHATHIASIIRRRSTAPIRSEPAGSQTAWDVIMTDAVDDVSLSDQEHGA